METKFSEIKIRIRRGNKNQFKQMRNVRVDTALGQKSGHIHNRMACQMNYKKRKENETIRWLPSDGMNFTITMPCVVLFHIYM